MARSPQASFQLAAVRLALISNRVCVGAELVDRELPLDPHRARLLAQICRMGHDEHMFVRAWDETLAPRGLAPPPRSASALVASPPHSRPAVSLAGQSRPAARC